MIEKRIPKESFDGGYPIIKLRDPIRLAPERFPLFEPLVEGRDSDRVQAEIALHEKLKSVFKVLLPVHEVFNKYGVPIVVTRSMAMYLWALSLHQSHLVDVHKRYKDTPEGDASFSDVDYLFPLEMWPELDAALNELSEAGVIELVPADDSTEEVHPRGLKSFYFRQCYILQNGRRIFKAEFFAGLGKIQKATDSSGNEITDFKTLQGITVGEDGEVIVMSNDEPTEEPSNLTAESLRRMQLMPGEEGSNIRFLVGEPLINSYLEELDDRSIESALHSSSEGIVGRDTIRKESKITKFILKLRLLEALLGRDKAL